MLQGEFVPEFILAIVAVIRVFFRSRSATALEVLALRQQVAVLKRKRPRPRLNPLDRLFWTTLRQLWPRWKNVLVIVNLTFAVGSIWPFVFNEETPEVHTTNAALPAA